MRLWFGKIGLGPNYLGPIRYLLPYNSRFHIAARFHDIAYGRGGNEDDRKRVDEMFYRLMMAVANTHLQRLFAYIYYKLCRYFGKYFFTYKFQWKIAN